MAQIDAPFVRVEVRPINQTDQNSRIINDQENDLTGIYADYTITNRYDQDEHVYMLGNTSPDGFAGNQDTVSFVQVSNRTVLWMVDWTAARYKYQPKIPDPSLRSELSSAWVFLYEVLEPGVITLASDNVTPRYRISGTYFYGLRRPGSSLATSIRFPRLPWVEDFATRSLPGSAFQKDLSS